MIFKTANPKCQVPKNFQAPIFKSGRAHLTLGYWRLFGVWCLGFGALARGERTT